MALLFLILLIATLIVWSRQSSRVKKLAATVDALRERLDRVEGVAPGSTAGLARLSAMDAPPGPSQPQAAGGAAPEELLAATALDPGFSVKVAPSVPALSAPPQKLPKIDVISSGSAVADPQAASAQTNAVSDAANRLWTTLKKNWFATVGAALLLLGVSFLFPLLVNHGFFPPILRLAAALALGCALMGIGMRLSRRKPEYSQVLQGAGAAVLYLAAYSAMAFYHMLPESWAFAFFTALSAFVIALSHKQSGKPLAFLGFAGAYVAPVLTIGGADNLPLLLAYGLLVNAASLWQAFTKRWIELAGQAFFWSLLIGFLLYHDAQNAPVSMPLIEQQLFLAAYSALFAFFPLLYARHARPGANGETRTLLQRERVALQAMAAIATPVALAMEFWIAGRFGMTVGAAIAAVIHGAQFARPQEPVAENKPLHGALFVASLLLAIAAPQLGATVGLLLAAALGVAVYALFPQPTRLLALLPLSYVALCAIWDAQTHTSGIAAAMLIAVGWLSVERRSPNEAWFFHTGAAFFTLVCEYAAFGRMDNGPAIAFAINVALSATLGLWHSRNRDWSALACFFTVSFALLVGCFVEKPTTHWAAALEILSGAGLWLIAAFVLTGRAHMERARLALLIAGFGLIGAWGVQHIFWDSGFLDIVAWLGWPLSALLGSFLTPAIVRWVGEAPASERQGVVILTAIALIAQWALEVVFSEHASSPALQAVWMIGALALIGFSRPQSERRTLISASVALMSAYFLAQAGSQAGITLAWSITGLASVVAGSRLGDRRLWLAGAAINGLVVCKLIFFDMSVADPIWRVMSFIGSGLLFLIAGYLAPAPARDAPSDAENTSQEP